MIIPFDCNKVRLTSPFGERTLNGAKQFHGGYDLVGVGSYEVTATFDGEVVQSRIITNKSNLTWQWGNYICIRDNSGLLHYYCHLEKRYVKVGAKVKQGQKIGYMGNTGYSFGAHLHYEIRNGSKQINPEGIIGIPNKVGVYQKKSKLEEDLNVLQKAEIINTPSYWLENAHKLQYVPELINKFANYVRRGGV